jgi:Uma2 family endonuclease
MVATATQPLSQLYAESRYSVAEYLDIEIQQGERYEFFNGEIVKMAEGTIRHNLITSNVIFALNQALHEDDDIYIFGSDQKIYLPKYNFYVYPDAVVVSETPIVSEKGHALMNPILIVEVLSSSTEDYDKGQKFLQYQSIPTFKEYLLVRQDLAEVATFFREEPDLWRSGEVEGLENEVFLKSVKVSLALAKIYKKVF